MSLHQIHIFISHSWAHSGHYMTLREWIFEQSWRIGQAENFFCGRGGRSENGGLDRESVISGIWELYRR